MSAWLVSRRHIDAIAGFLAHRTEPGTFNYGPKAHIARLAREAKKAPKDENNLATALGRILWLENIASLRARYPDAEKEWAAAEKEARAYIFTPADLDALAKCFGASTDGMIHHAIACLDYQSCEHPGWRRSCARWLLDKAERDILARLVKPLIGKTPWGIDEDTTTN